MLLLNLAIFRYGFCRDLASMTSGPQACNFIKKETQVSQCFLVNFVKLLRTAFFIEHLWWLLLNFQVLTKVFPLLALPWLYLL